jgi:hypothetical protein
MKAIQIEAFGNPAEVVKVVDIPDIGAPAAGKVVIALEASPINQYDLLMIAGGYGYRPRLPAIMGTEGVGPWLRPLPPGDINQFAMMGVNPPNRLSPADRHREIAARILGHPEWRQFRHRAGNSRDREIAWLENGQCRPS